MTGYYAESCITHCHHLCYCHVRVQPWTFGLITQEVRELEKPLRETTANHGSVSVLGSRVARLLALPWRRGEVAPRRRWVWPSVHGDRAARERHR